MAIANAVKVEIDGVQLINYTSIEIRQHIYGMNEFKVVARLDSMEELDGFVLNKSKSFIGSAIVISIDVSQKGDGSKPERIIFKGLITNLQATRSAYFDNDNIILIGKSPEFLLDDIAGYRSFENKNLKQIVSDVLTLYPRDLLKNIVNPRESSMFEYTVQYNESSYSFLRRLAKRYGEWMFYNGTEFYFGKISPKLTAELTLGIDQTAFDFGINLKPINFKYKFHDYLKNKTIENKATKSKGKSQQNEIGGIAHDKSVKHAVYEPQVFINNLNVDKGSFAKHLSELTELKENAQAAGMSTVSGSSVNPMVKLCNKIKVGTVEMGKTRKIDFGEYIVTEVKHFCDNLGSYKNEFKGISAEATVPDYTVPEVKINCEPQTAVVIDNKDPEKLGRIKVRFVWQEPGQTTPWIRIANPHSGVDRGMYFTPDIDDEVLVGFEGNDPERPFVMGSVYNGKGKPESIFPQQDNSIKGLMFKGISLQFDEGSGATTIQTPGKKKFTLNDKEKKITIEDDKKNSIELSPDGITMNCMKNLDITVTGDFNLTAGGAMAITSGKNLDTTVGSSASFMSGGAYSFTSGGAANYTVATDYTLNAGKSANINSAMINILGGLVKIN